MPHNFKISPLPSVIESRCLAMLQRLPAATQQREARQRSKIALGFDFKSSYKKSKSNMTLSLTHSPTNTRSPSFLISQARFATLVASTVRSSVDYVGSSFRNNFRRDPRLDEDGKPSRVLSKQYKGYKTRTQTSLNKKHSLSALSSTPSKIKQQQN